MNQLEERPIVSVGIDIGTSTTKFIVSHLKYAKVSHHFSLPRYEIVERKIVYESPMHPTPLKETRHEINLEALSIWLEKQYRSAGISVSEIKSGAVIITGETATKKNAQNILHYLAEKAGDFVVAVAGASLEGVLAGKGSGAFLRSQQVKEVIANVDIGGGTANVAIFQKGKVLGTITYHVGGRLIELNRDGEIISISPSIDSWLRSKNYLLSVNQKLDFRQIQQLVREMCKDMLKSLTGQKQFFLDDPLIHSASVQTIPIIDEIMISGGIGLLLGEEAPKTMDEVTVYGDVGPLLAHELIDELRKFPSIKLVEASQTSRATVIGAGMQSTEISGATIFVASSRLPLRNLPIMLLELNNEQLRNSKYMCKHIKQAMTEWANYFPKDQENNFAIHIRGISNCSYVELKELAQLLFSCYRKYFSHNRLLAVVCENDVAKALGQLLMIQSNGQVDIISIDQITVEHGDYIDIGETINQSVVPVVVKTLAFMKN